MTANQRRKVLQALTQTCELLEKEMRYSPDLRKPDYIAWLEKHIAKLESMLDSDTLTLTF